MEEEWTIFQEKATNIPLAEKVRPTKLEEIIGQENILGENKQLRTMIQNDDFSSFIMWGPPGSGKTTIARLIQAQTKNRFLSFSAVLSSIKDVKSVMKEAAFTLQTQNKATILFVDEIHRFNKSQQDAFLPYIESGAVILIGATTENPSFEVIPALLSRCHVFVLDTLTENQISEILERAIGLNQKQNEWDEIAIFYLADHSGGDARKALNHLESVLKYRKNNLPVTIEEIKSILSKQAMFYDKNKEEHYNVISALHKSLRGSDPQAGLYWLARMLEAGEDPLYIVRRLVRFASEDIGLADPNALVQAVAVKDAVHFLGMPEANTALAQLVVYLATAPKSNALYSAYALAREDAHKTSHFGVPFTIRNAPTKLMKDLDYGKDYEYDHLYENAYRYQKYFPTQMKEKIYYKPAKFGFEKEIQKRLDWWEKLKGEQLKTKK
jgi:putative ATPase